MLGHLGLNVPDLAAAKRYYDDLMPRLAFEPFVSSADQFSYRPAGGKPGTHVFFYGSQEPGPYSCHRTGLQHLAFMVHTRAEVDALHELVTSRGETVLHEPQEFPQYHAGYYATFWLDPFGFKLEAVCHRDRSQAAQPGPVTV